MSCILSVSIHFLGIKIKQHGVDDSGKVYSLSVIEI